MDTWLKHEVATNNFKDKRLETRFINMMHCMHQNYGKTIPEMFNDWGEVKAAYRFLSNERVNENEILQSHFANTQKRVISANGPALLLHDTSEFSYKRKKPDDIGFISRKRKPSTAKHEIPQHISVCGILMHASFAITQDGLPLGLMASRFWTRRVFKNTKQMKRHINPTRIPVSEKESAKWLYNLDSSLSPLNDAAAKVINICDREGDMYELFCACEELNTNFIVRTSLNRQANESTVAEEMSFGVKNFKHKIKFENSDKKMVETRITVMTKRLILHPPVAKAKSCKSLPITVISAIEDSTPKDRDKIKWTLYTNLEVKNKAEALKVLNWYKMPWKIE